MEWFGNECTKYWQETLLYLILFLFIRSYFLVVREKLEIWKGKIVYGTAGAVKRRYKKGKIKPVWKSKCLELGFF